MLVVVQHTLFSSKKIELNCDTKKISSNLENEIKLAILKKAAILEKEGLEKTKKRIRKEKKLEKDAARDTLFDK